MKGGKNTKGRTARRTARSTARNTKGSTGRSTVRSTARNTKGSTARRKDGAQLSPIDIISGVFAGLLKVANKEDLGVILQLILKLLDKKLTAADCSVIKNVKNYFKEGRGKGIAKKIIASNPAIKGWLKTVMKKDSNLRLIDKQLGKCSIESGSQVKIGGAWREGTESVIVECLILILIVVVAGLIMGSFGGGGAAGREGDYIEKD